MEDCKTGELVVNRTSWCGGCERCFHATHTSSSSQQYGVNPTNNQNLILPLQARHSSRRDPPGVWWQWAVVAVLVGGATENYRC